MWMTALLVYCIPLVFHSAVLFQSAEAVSAALDVDPVSVSYNAVSDPCIQLNESSKREEKEAANKKCWHAFLALDQNNANSCRGWRHPECRILSGFSYRQCSCIISISNQSGIKTDETKSFRGCALDLWTDRYFIGPFVAPSGFKELFKSVERSAIAARERARSTYNSFNAGTTSFRTGTSSVSNTSYRTKVPGGTSTPSQYDAGTSEGNAARAGGKTYQCDFCDSIYQSVSALSNHRKQHTEDLQCKICQKRCSSRSNFRRHVKGVHKGNTAAASSKSPIVQKIYMEAYNSKKPFVCGDCGARYAQERTLKMHRISHDDPQSTTCTLCNQLFSTTSNLQAHMKLKH